MRTRATGRGFLVPVGWGALIAALGVTNIAILTSSLILANVAGVSALAGLFTLRRARSVQVAAQNAATSRLHQQIDAFAESVKRIASIMGSRQGGSHHAEPVAYAGLRGTTRSGRDWGAAVAPGTDADAVADAVENLTT